MSSYYARIIQGMGAERLVAITGRTGVALRVIDVDATGHPIGGAAYVPANVPQVELIVGPNGFLVEPENDTTQEIDWEAHESTTGQDNGSEEENSSDVSSVSPRNPALGAFPQLQ
jgi:hypothetical protein